MPIDKPQVRKVIIPIRYPTKSRQQIAIIVAQTRSPMGQWKVPIITFEGHLGPFLESGSFGVNNQIIQGNLVVYPKAESHVIPPEGTLEGA